MKKLFVILAAVALIWAFAAPASAVDWNFYGSARMATYWTSTETGDGATKVEDSELDWAGQNNSRIGAKVKGETVSAQFELGLTGKDTSDWDPGDGDGIQVRSRRLQGDWNFGAGTLSVGKGYASYKQFTSGQVARGDGGLLGQGFMYGGRPYFIGLSFGGFGIEFIDPKTDDITGVTGADVDTVFPKVEAHWGMSFDAFSFNLIGGYQYFNIDKLGPTSSDDTDVTSYGLGAEGKFNFGPAYVAGGLSFTQNGGNAGWTAGSATFDAVNIDTDDTETFQGGIVVGFKMSDMVSFEGGFGYRTDDFDVSGVDNTDSWEVYVQSVVGLAPGVYIIPEFGYRDSDAEGKDDDSTDWYLGGKWQIDF
jgi:hypothetical protein